MAEYGGSAPDWRDIEGRETGKPALELAVASSLAAAGIPQVDAAASEA
jgi:hypothetical protein